MKYFVELIQKVLLSISFRKTDDNLASDPHSINLVVSILCIVCSKKIAFTYLNKRLNCGSNSFFIGIKQKTFSKVKEGDRVFCLFCFILLGLRV